jgi:hypothetical protein
MLKSKRRQNNIRFTSENNRLKRRNLMKRREKRRRNSRDKKLIKSCIEKQRKT